MKKFKVTVTRTAEYEVTVDEKKWGFAEQQSFERSLYRLPCYVDKDGNLDVEAAGGFARALAEQTSKHGIGKFIEGFGMCGTDKEIVDYWNKLPDHKDNQFTDGLYISENYDEIESEIEEVKED